MLTAADVEEAYARIRANVHHTPLRHSTTLSRLTGANVFLKFENLQRTGSFKIRGALNKISQLTEEERARGVVAASAGNHAQGVALAARLHNTKAVVVMPEHASIQKAEATRGYGAEVILHGKDFNEAQEHCFQIQRERGMTLVHAYNDPAIMAGQGTIGIEILEDLPDVEAVVAGVGGGGLLSGVSTYIKARRPSVKIIGVQPESTSSLKPSLQAGKLVVATASQTIADGLATKSVGDRTFPILQKTVDQAVTVTDDEIAHAILLLLERQKNVVEGAGAAPLAALLGGSLDLKGKKVCCLISGGNIDINVLDGIILRGLEEAGRVLRFSTIIGDRPGQLRNLLDVIASNRGNVRDVRHERNRVGIPLGSTMVDLDVETQGQKHRDQLVAALKKAGYLLRD